LVENYTVLVHLVQISQNNAMPNTWIPTIELYFIASWNANEIRFEVLTAVKMTMLLVWVVTPCRLVGRYQSFHSNLLFFWPYWLIDFDGVRLRLWTAATNVHPPDDVSWRAAVEWYWQGKTEDLGKKKPVSVPLCPQQIPHGLAPALTLLWRVRVSLLPSIATSALKNETEYPAEKYWRKWLI
jgi:hypothetical protein